MTSDEVLKLIDAGFTAEEIRGMSAGQSEQKAAQEQNKGTEQSADGATHEGEIKIDPQMEALNNTVKSLNETVKAMQDANLKNARSESSATDSVNNTINDFLKSL